MLSEISRSPSAFASPLMKADEQTEIILMAGSPVGFGMTKGVGDTAGLAVGEGFGLTVGEGFGLTVGEGFGLGDTVGEGEGHGQQVGDAVGEGDGSGVAVGETEGEGLDDCAKAKDIRSIKKLMATMAYIICL